MSISNLETVIEYKFKKSASLKEALTHRSYLNENPSWEIPNNERLEFLGDAILELAVTEELYNRFPDDDEGKLTTLRAALVNYQMLAQIGKEMMLDKEVLLSKGEAKDMGKARDVIIADTMEALIGAIYLDSDYSQVKIFINRFVLVKLEEVLKNGSYRDAKSLLQEKAQSDKKVTPVYKLLEESGPEHQKLFKVGVYLGEDYLASGEGYSKQEAELEAAKKALEKL